MDVNQKEDTELLEEQNAAPNSHQDDDVQMLRAAKDANDTNTPASGELAVYRWYFQAAGSLNFIMFLVLSSVFVVGTIYPRMTSPYPHKINKRNVAVCEGGR
jgi:hypothetical protein